MSFFFQAEDGIRDLTVTGVQTCALPIWNSCPGGAALGQEFPARLIRIVTSPPGGNNDFTDRKSVVQGKSVDLGGCRNNKKNHSLSMTAQEQLSESRKYAHTPIHRIRYRN